MTDLDKPLRQKLEQTARLIPPAVARKQESRQDGTIENPVRLLPVGPEGEHPAPGIPFRQAEALRLKLRVVGMESCSARNGRAPLTGCWWTPPAPAWG